MRLKLISCEILYREMCAAIARSPNTVDVDFLPKGLHDIGQVGMLERLQTAVDRVDASRYEAVALGYGLCNNGLVGLKAGVIPLVAPRGHDCITLFLGSKERYLGYFNAHPGVFFETTGWIERGEDSSELSQLAIGHRMGLDASFEELVRKYGEDNAKYLLDEMARVTRNYSQFTFIEMGVEPDMSFERRAREEAVRRGWQFRKGPGGPLDDPTVVDGLLDEKEFLVVPPGKRIAALYDNRIIGAEEASS